MRSLTFAHYNIKKQGPQPKPSAWGIYFTPIPRIGVNLDIYVGAHIFVLWFYPTRKYGKGTR